MQGNERERRVLAIFFAMVLVLVVAGLVLAYCAYPHRGQEMPKAPWIGEALERAVESAPTIDKTADDSRSGEQHTHIR